MFKDGHNIGGNFRIGYKFKSGLYLFYQFAGAYDDYSESHTEYIREYDYDSGLHYYQREDVSHRYFFYCSNTFHIGFNFLNKKGKNTVIIENNK